MDQFTTYFGFKQQTNLCFSVCAGHENILYHPQLAGDENLATPDSELQGYLLRQSRIGMAECSTLHRLNNAQRSCHADAVASPTIVVAVTLTLTLTTMAVIHRPRTAPAWAALPSHSNRS
jgi:hypothetical protein